MTIDWINCPVCDEPDMRSEDGVITCTNLQCASNGGPYTYHEKQSKMQSHRCMKDEWKGKCCCTCFWHWPDYGHPWTNGSHVTEQRGWVCANPELFDGSRAVISGWGEHGMCEVWTGKDQVKLIVEWLPKKRNIPNETT